jgi:XTP/dITP diphosphohydrolase
MDILLATSNRHKIAEFRRLFDDSPITLTTGAEAGFEPIEVPEHGITFLENAITKAYSYVQAYSMPSLADDSGICVDALGGAPGIRSTRFGAPDLDDGGRLHYLVDCMRAIPPSRRGAHYVCALVLARPDRMSLCSEGRLYGQVADEPREGTTGFGYDPVFIVPRFGATVAELTTQQKDSVSHRGQAVRRLLALLSREA